jgi:prolyl-tRNA synthetase
MAIPVLKGTKSENEKFAGAIETYCVEALMQDGKALQVGTSHFLGQNFAKAFDVQFSTPQGKKEYVWGTSWGVSTRLVGALVMAHSDKKGLVLPPNLAPIQVVMIPIFNNEKEYEKINNAFNKIASQLDNKNISYKIDNRKNNKPGWKFAEYELKGVPIRLALGPKDLENNTIEITRRDTLKKETTDIKSIRDKISNYLIEIQNNIYKKANDFKNKNSHTAKNYEDFKNIIKNKSGFVYAHWDGTVETEEKIKKETKATIRCIPITKKQNAGKCMVTGKKSKGMVVFAKAY